MDLGDRKKTVSIKESHRHGMSYTKIPGIPEHDEESFRQAVDNEEPRSFHYNRNGVKCVIKPNVSNVYGNVNRTLYEVEVATHMQRMMTAHTWRGNGRIQAVSTIMLPQSNGQWSRFNRE